MKKYYDRAKEKRIYIRGEFTRKSGKRLYFHTAGVFHIFRLYNLLGPEISFSRKSKIDIKRKTKLDSMPFNDDFRYKS